MTGNQRKQVILIRLRIGYTSITHKYLSGKKDPEKCPKFEQEWKNLNIDQTPRYFKVRKKEHNSLFKEH